MRKSLERLFAYDRLARARATAAVAVAAGAAVWVCDALVDAVVLDERSFADELLRPGARELWIRVLVTTCVVLLWRARLHRQRMRLFSSALAAAPDGVQITSLEGIISYSNQAVRDIYGFAPEALLGHHVNELNADPTFASREIIPAIQRRGSWQGELYVKHADGHVFPIWLSTSMVAGAAGRPIAMIGVIRDISERKRAEQELREYARRLEDATTLKDLFADILRHDLLGPASTVQLSLDSMLKRAPDAEAARKILETARRSNAKLIDMIEGAAMYAKLSAARQLEFRSLDLGQVLAEVISDFDVRGGERGARILFRTPGTYPARAHPLVADVFENLLSNALKYGPEGGTVSVDVADAGDAWTVSVTDQGEGIPDCDKEKVFVRFERLRKEGVKGTGLGLAIARRIVDLHGGRIWVEDAPGGGATFRTTLLKA
jgi:PAS domain S-box-containing protein